MRAGANAVFRWLAVLILAAIVVQFFLAGYGVFGGRTSDTSSAKFPEVSTLDAHRALGDIIILLALILVLVALAAGKRGSAMGEPGGLLILTLLQSVLAHLGTDTGALFGGLHVLNALAILAVAGRIVSTSRRGPPAATT
jgi:uncharacterized membrane protein AbrB (regulator of aidB expression)